MNYRNDVLFKYFIVTALLVLCQAKQSIQCSCPAVTCMTTADLNERCKCCVRIMLGKRSSPERSVYTANLEKSIFPIPLTKLSDAKYLENDVPTRLYKTDYLSNILSGDRPMHHQFERVGRQDYSWQRRTQSEYNDAGVPNVKPSDTEGVWQFY